MFLRLNCFTSSSTLCFRLLNWLSICFLSNRSSFLNSWWWSHTRMTVSFISLSIFSFVSCNVSLTLFISTRLSKSFVSMFSDISWTSRFIRSRMAWRWSSTFTKSSSITLNVLPIHEKSGTSFTSFTHFGNFGISDLTWSICWHIAFISSS